MKKKLVDWTYTPQLAMVTISHNLEYGPYEDHTFINPISPFAPFTKLTRVPQDGLTKLCNDQSMPFHTTLGIPHKILYLHQWELWWEPQTY